MRTIALPSGVEFTIKESIKELTADRYKDFQKYLIQSAGFGSTMEDVDRHFRNLDVFMANGKMDSANQERENMRMNMFLMLNRINIDHAAFACLIDSIDGDPVRDYSENNMLDVVNKLGAAGLKQTDVEDIISDVKKKSIGS